METVDRQMTANQSSILALGLVTVVGRARARSDDAPTLDRLLLAAAEADQGWHTWDTLYLKKSLP